jgi:hypothetical protein
MYTNKYIALVSKPVTLSTIQNFKTDQDKTIIWYEKNMYSKNKMKKTTFMYNVAL